MQPFKLIFSFVPLFLALVPIRAQDRCWNIPTSRYPEIGDITTIEGAARQSIGIGTKQVVPDATVLEGDVSFSKRTWSVIDLSDKNNQMALVGPSERKYWSLWTVIRFHLEVEPNLTVYELGYEGDDSFRFPLHPSDSAACNRLEQVLFMDTYHDSLNDTGQPILDSLTELPLVVESRKPIIAEDIQRYYLKTDWFFDKKRSVFEQRIIGIAPAIEQLDEVGNVVGHEVLFWLYYPELKHIINHYKSPLSEHHTNAMTYADTFRMQKYNAQIVHESCSPGASLRRKKLEDPRSIEHHRVQTEHDLWRY